MLESSSKCQWELFKGGGGTFCGEAKVMFEMAPEVIL